MDEKSKVSVSSVLSFLTRRFSPKYVEDIEKGIRPEFDPSGEGYDYASALRQGVRRSVEDGHMQSRAPDGQILKGSSHPTFYKTIQGEREAGFELYIGEDGKIYSRKMRKTK